MTNDDEWPTFLAAARLAMGTGWWTAKELIAAVDPKVLPWQLTWSSDTPSTKSLGSLLRRRSGQEAGLVIESKGSGKVGLKWRLRTLDEVLSDA